MNYETKICALRFAMEAVAEMMHDCNNSWRETGINALLLIGQYIADIDATSVLEKSLTNLYEEEETDESND